MWTHPQEEQMVQQQKQPTNMPPLSISQILVIDHANAN